MQVYSSRSVIFTTSPFRPEGKTGALKSAPSAVRSDEGRYDRLILPWAVVGSKILPISVTLVAGKPLSCACW